MGRRGKRRGGIAPAPPRQSILYHVLCTMTEAQLRLLLGIMAGNTRHRAATMEPHLHPIMDAWMRMESVETTWIDAMERVATGAMPGLVWPRLLILASLTQSFGALELLATECEFMTDVLCARPLAELQELLKAINEELHAWIGRHWALPELVVDGIRQRFYEGDVR